MEMIQVGNRGVLFHFDSTDGQWQHESYIYVIKGRYRVFVCDTNSGQASMAPIIDLIKKECPTHEIVVFNSHAHWDHYWGNGAFVHADFIAHKRSKEIMIEQGEMMLKWHGYEKNGLVSIVLPNITFADKFEYLDDGVVFFYTPGHSQDSSSCFDMEDNIVYTGDLIENPIPNIEWHDLDAYEKSVDKILKLSASVIISAHSGIVTSFDIAKNVQYLKDLKSQKNVYFKDKQAQNQHEYNLRLILVSKYEEEARLKLGNKFDIRNYAEFLDSLTNKPLIGLDKTLASYLTIHA